MARSKYITNVKANPFQTKEEAADAATAIEIIIPTAAQSPTLRTVLGTWQRQTIAHRTRIIDTSQYVSDALTSHINYTRRPHTQLMWYAPQPHKHRCEIITATIDAAIATTPAAWIILTHDDVWQKTNTIIENLLTRAKQHNVPIVGYEMSPRDHATTEWHGMPSHTLTLLNVAYCRANRLRWDITEAIKYTPENERHPGWPDTETHFGRQVKLLKTQIVWLGHETNDQHYEDDLIVHRRSLTSLRTIDPHGQPADHEWITRQNRRFNQDPEPEHNAG